MNIVTLIDGTKVDSASEAWRHECEARTFLAMPQMERLAYLSRVEAKKGRGLPERRRLESTIMQIWTEQQVTKLLAMPRDDMRAAHLLNMQQANKHVRGRVEAAMERRVTANNNKLKEDDEHSTSET